MIELYPGRRLLRGIQDLETVGSVFTDAEALILRVLCDAGVGDAYKLEPLTYSVARVPRPEPGLAT